MAEQITIKEVLHQTIEDINDESVLYAAYKLLQRNKGDEQLALSEAQLNILCERDMQYQSGKMKVYSLEEFDIEMKRKYGF